jgi:hypothetical protein
VRQCTAVYGGGGTESTEHSARVEPHMPRLILLLVLLAAGCTFPRPTVTLEGAAPVELPFRVAADGLVLITGRVNARHDVEFILDTGAPVTVLIDNARTRGLNLDTTGARRLGGDDPASPMGVIRGGYSIVFGRVAFTDLTAVVIPGASLPCPERFDAIGFGGVIGADLLRRFVVEIDWARRVARLHEPSAWSPPAGAHAVALTFDAGHPYVESTIRLPDGRAAPTRLHLDTGMNLGLALATGAGKPFVAPADGRERSTCFVNGRSVAIEGPPVTVELGPMRLAGVTPVYAPAAGASSTRQSGALGAAALSRQALVIDYPRSRIYIGQP